MSLHLGDGLMKGHGRRPGGILGGLPWQYRADVLVYGVLILPNLLGFAGYFWLIARITSGMRYANK